MMYIINKPIKSEYNDIIKIWESSVRATHHFLKEEDIQYYKGLMEEKYLDAVDLYCIRNKDNKISGFIGVSGKKLEMLFIHADARGKGFGKRLLEFAICKLNISKVDVNEQNEKAFDFYKHFNFKVISRSEQDATGKKYPIIHMQL